MWQGIYERHLDAKWFATRCIKRSIQKRSVHPYTEVLEDRQLLSASLAPISALTVPAQLGYQLPLDGSGTKDPSQTFTGTSSNPDIQVSVAQGPFWTLTISHQAANSSDITINNETVTFLLFQDLTPNTVSRIQTLTNDNFYTQGLANTLPAGPGKFIPRITSVASTGFSIVQGGSSSASSTASSSGIPPINTEPVQQLAFTGQYQLALANTGQPTSTDAQFFITNGTLAPAVQQALDFNYTIIGQLVSGQQTMADLSKVSVQTNSFGETSQPITPVTITNVSLSSQNPNGALHVDTTSAKPGETATITVTAKDPSDNSSVARSFNVTVSAYNGPADPVINFVPLASPVTANTNASTPVTVQLTGHSGYPDSNTSSTLTYQLLSQPAHGTISQFNASTGSLVYTPNPGYNGPDSFQFDVQSTGPMSAPATTVSHAAMVSINVAAPLVTLSGVDEVFNRAHRLTEILVHWSGALNASEASKTGIYRLALPGRKGSYTARNATVIRLKNATYNALTDTVTLKLRSPLAFHQVLQLKIAGLPPSGLTDSLGRLIDGDHNGTPGGDAVAYLYRSGRVLIS
jgi:cyclophilin family peptidyl-prolyl cis-trans isomerase